MAVDNVVNARCRIQFIVLADRFQCLRCHLGHVCSFSLVGSVGWKELKNWLLKELCFFSVVCFPFPRNSPASWGGGEV